MAIPTHIVAAGGIVEDGNGNILLVSYMEYVIAPEFEIKYKIDISK